MSLFHYLIIILISFLATYLSRKIAIRKSIIDIPGIRSSHTEPTPLGGGFAILIAWLIGLIYLFISNQIPQNLFIALMCGIPLAIVGLLDDIIGLSPKIRLLFQFFSVLAGLYFIGGIQRIDFGFFVIENIWILSVIGVFGMIWFINSFNFLDGIDGYAAIEAIFISLGIYVFLHDSILLTLICAVLGFLYWNWPKAKIFMGDAGSMLLGYTLICLGLFYNNSGDFDFLNWLILSSLFWFDATVTLIRRMRRREKLSVAHKKHAYQRIVQAGFSHKKVVVYAIFLNLINLLFILGAIQYPNFILVFILFNIAFLSMIYWRIEKKIPFK